MMPFRVRNLLLAIVAVMLQGCISSDPIQGLSRREPVRWLLVERPYGEVAAGPKDEDGAINPNAVVLAFQPLYPEDLKWDILVEAQEQFVELVSFTPQGAAVPGEVVSAVVRVAKAKPDQLYRLSAKTSQCDVRILGEAHTIVKGNEPAVFRFTSCVSGRAGIAVGVERIGSDERRTP
jgi:hypothetical protein